MSILLNKETGVIFQGITGNFGRYHSRLMLDYGTRIVAGVTPGRGGEEVNGVPVYDSVAEALAAHRAEAAITMVPAPFALDSVREAVDAGLDLVACVVEGVPVHDMLVLRRRLRESGTVLLGPNSPGLITPGEAVLGFLPPTVFRPGRVGMVSRSGNFSYRVAQALSAAGIGQSSCVGIGGDPVTGVSFVDILRRFEADPATDAVVLVGEIGRTAEEEAAEYIGSEMRKPVVAIILGRTAPPDRQMGHAGAIVTAGRGSYASKVRALERAGVAVARRAAEVPALVREALAGVPAAQPGR
ncbi:MAG: succinate--CoA ligase subunit alpha [Armatimonadota bacterium]|nr:succinate--CoA ligase subunit alpha [Armatimonadota bacterium]